MPVESGTNISELDPNWPLGTDTATRGDDHLRLIKSVLKAQFPGEVGDGFAKPITVTEDFLNSLPDAIQAIEDEALARYPIGKVELFIDDTDPNDIYPGVWELITGTASLSLGDGSTSVGNISGNDQVAVPLVLHNHSSGSLTTTTNGSHAHGGWAGPASAGSGGGADPGQRLSSDTGTDSAGNHSHSIQGNTGSTGESSPTMDVSGARIPVNVWKRIG